MCNHLYKLMSYLYLFLGLLNMHVCPKYWPVAETTCLKLDQEAWGSPRVQIVCLPLDWRHLVMPCLMLEAAPRLGPSILFHQVFHQAHIRAGHTADAL